MCSEMATMNESIHVMNVSLKNNYQMLILLNLRVNLMSFCLSVFYPQHLKYSYLKMVGKMTLNLKGELIIDKITLYLSYDYLQRTSDPH